MKKVTGVLDFSKWTASINEQFEEIENAQPEELKVNSGFNEMADDQIVTTVYYNKSNGAVMCGIDDANANDIRGALDSIKDDPNLIAWILVPTTNNSEGLERRFWVADGKISIEGDWKIREEINSETVKDY